MFGFNYTRKTEEDRKLMRAFALLYKQVTDGCGNKHCTNTDCASCPDFKLKNEVRVERGARVMEFFTQGCKLCETANELEDIWDDEEPALLRGDQILGWAPENMYQPWKPKMTLEQEPPVDDIPEDIRAVQGPTPFPPDHFGGAQEEEEPPLTIHADFPRYDQQPIPNATGSLDLETVLNLVENSIKAKAFTNLNEKLASVFSSVANLSESFHKPEGAAAAAAGTFKRAITHRATNHPDISLDYDALHQAIERLFADNVKEQIRNSLCNALVDLTRDLTHWLVDQRRTGATHSFINVFLIVLELPVLLEEPYVSEVTPRFLHALGYLPFEEQRRMVLLFSMWTQEKFQDHVQLALNYIIKRITDRDIRQGEGNLLYEDQGIVGAARFARILWYGNFARFMNPPDIIARDRKFREEIRYHRTKEYTQNPTGFERRKILQVKTCPLGAFLDLHHLDARNFIVTTRLFPIEELSNIIDPNLDYERYQVTGDPFENFCFMDFPYLIKLNVRTNLFRMVSRTRKAMESREATYKSLMFAENAEEKFLLRLRQHNLFEDAQAAIENAAMEDPFTLKRPLYVEYTDSPGEDIGGLSRDMLNNVFNKFLDPTERYFGRITNESSAYDWFMSPKADNANKYALFGAMMGLALYNEHLVEFDFPEIFYKYLMGRQWVYDDFEAFDPDAYRTFQNMLKDGYGTYFYMPYTDYVEVTMVDGKRRESPKTLDYELCEGGLDIATTPENIQEFYQLQCEHRMWKKDEKHIRAMVKGFWMVMDESPLMEMFTIKDFETLLCGEDYGLMDIIQFIKPIATYEDGYTEDHPAVVLFWQVCAQLTSEEQKALVTFTAGNARMPNGGFKRGDFVIGPLNKGVYAHTCMRKLTFQQYNDVNQFLSYLRRHILTGNQGIGGA